MLAQFFTPCEMTKKETRSDHILKCMKNSIHRLAENYAKEDNVLMVVIQRWTKLIDRMVFANITCTVQIAFVFSRNELKVTTIFEGQAQQGIDQRTRFIPPDQSAHGNFGFQICKIGKREVTLNNMDRSKEKTTEGVFFADGTSMRKTTPVTREI